MKRNFTASVSQEGRWFIAQCIEVDVASQGESEEAALNNLRDALELHFFYFQQTHFAVSDNKKIPAAAGRIKELESSKLVLKRFEPRRVVFDGFKLRVKLI